jgi:tetratricopeptide (TPR) repeat protein
MPQRKEHKSAEVRDATLDEQINPQYQPDSVIETVPLMNNAVKNLYNQALNYYNNKAFDTAIVQLERAYEIQPNAPQVSQLLAEIYMHKGDFKQAHYWASIATKNGPSKGKMCEKSWRILALSAEKLGYFANQSHALERKEKCVVKAAARY